MLRIIFKIFREIFYAISIIAIAVLGVLNTTIVYRYVIHKYELSNYTGLSTEILMDNYKRIIYYVQNPLSKELILNNLSMSNFGKIHFFEVKQIFISLYIISIVFISIIIFKIVTNRNNNLGKRIIKMFNNSVNIIALMVISISTMAVIDFSKTFYFFHKIFFRNDYWIFDPIADPIINALPEELFMIEIILIISLLILFTIVIKVLRLKNKD
ncbi:MAG: TIGR01906 family membrane protein [Clostridium sp.]|uniref:TIGR01906 family membrane protein n=1 Tax=Clostridium sp. TaxID=1506 RepID=UPI0025B8FEC8|nr:TIGR01906 family membrane protein [Clostridium sp.]MCE5221755.1 TIGR01906 family membrane protein [Clostridium sp.]